MFTSIGAMVQALAEMGQSLFQYLTKQKEKQDNTAILKDRNKLQVASDLSEQVFWCMREYMACDSQFTMWIARLFYDNLNKDEKRLFRHFYKQKMKIKKQIERKQKEFEKVN